MPWGFIGLNYCGSRERARQGRAIKPRNQNPEITKGGYGTNLRKSIETSEGLLMSLKIDIRTRSAPSEELQATRYISLPRVDRHLLTTILSVQ